MLFHFQAIVFPNKALTKNISGTLNRQLEPVIGLDGIVIKDSILHKGPFRVLTRPKMVGLNVRNQDTCVASVRSGPSKQAKYVATVVV